MSTELKQFDELQSELTKLVSPTRELKVVDVASSASAIEAAKAVKSLQKRIEEKRKELVAPLNDRVKEINDRAKDVLVPLIDAEKYLKAQLVTYEEEQEKLRCDEMLKAEAERKQKEAELLAKQEAERAALVALVTDEVDASDVFGSDQESPVIDHAAELEKKQQIERAHIVMESRSRVYDIKKDSVKNVRKQWKCEAEDIGLVPKEFLIITLNNAAVIAAARGGVTSIPGVKLWQETSIAIGANTYVPSARIK